MSLPYVTVYTITYNQCDTLMQTLQCLLAQDYEPQCYEIIVLDDGSKDGTSHEVHRFASQSPIPLKLITVVHEADYLSARRWNQCIASAHPQTSVFIQIDDVFMRPDFIIQHVKWHLKGLNYLVTGAKFEGNTETWDLGSCRRAALATNRQPTEIEHFTAVWGASLSFTRTLMNRVCCPPYDIPYDERMSGWGFHEVELALRMQLMGCNIIYDPTAGVFHREHSNETETNRQLKREQLIEQGIQRNTLYILNKHGLSHLPRW